MKKSLLLKVLTGSLILGSLATPMSAFATTRATHHNMEVSGKIVLPDTLLVLDIPLTSEFIINTKESSYEDMFSSTSITITNKSEKPIKITYTDGLVSLGQKAMSLVPSNFYTDWSKIDSINTEKYIALGVGEATGEWEDTSSIMNNGEKVWFDSKNKEIGTVKPATAGVSKSATMKLQGKHGVNFTRANGISASLYFKAELLED